jgi:hypothetical protein
MFPQHAVAHPSSSACNAAPSSSRRPFPPARPVAAQNADHAFVLALLDPFTPHCGAVLHPSTPPSPAVPASMSSLRDSSSLQQQSFDPKDHQKRSNTPPKLTGRVAEQSSGLDTSSTAMGDQATSSYFGKTHAPDRTPLQTGCFCSTCTLETAAPSRQHPA